MAKKAILGGFQAPGASPDPVRGGCFYINPSRRGPVAPPGGSGSQFRPGTGVPP